MRKGTLCLHIPGGVVGAVAAMSVKRITSILVLVYKSILVVMNQYIGNGEHYHVEHREHPK